MDDDKLLLLFTRVKGLSQCVLQSIVIIHFCRDNEFVEWQNHKSIKDKREKEDLASAMLTKNIISPDKYEYTKTNFC